MSLTRRRLFTGIFEPSEGAWIAARGREARMAGHDDGQMAASGAPGV